MRKFLDWQVLFGIALIALSTVLYLIHYAIFRDSHHIFLYLVGDIAFVPIEVLLVTVIIHRLLTIREKRAMLKKMNMVIGAFFSEAGTTLLKSFSAFDKNSENFGKDFIITNSWTSRNFSSVIALMKGYDCEVDSSLGDLAGLKQFLVERRSFLLGLLQNPNLLEHESFTDLLWAVFHVTEELENRADTKGLPDSDYNHLSGDIKRAYILLVTEWLYYMKHLKDDYPYLFSLAVRTNPFNPDAGAEIK